MRASPNPLAFEAKLFRLGTVLSDSCENIDDYCTIVLVFAAVLCLSRSPSRLSRIYEVTRSVVLFPYAAPSSLRYQELP